MDAASPTPPGLLLRERRIAQELSVRKLAGIIGVDPGYLSRIERGMAEPSKALLLRLSRTLEMPPGQVLSHAGKLPIDIER
jgi:transcriptional regulator with XRE-family HTH domain